MDLLETRALGIDPGTKSFDLCVLEEGRVVFEEILDSSELAEDPSLLIEATEEAMPLDLIAGPSGYGVELTYLKDLKMEILEDWYLSYILLLKKEDLESALERNDPGIMVYSAMTKTALEMKRRKWPVCYIPGVINLPTVAEHRKLNNLDMGTVDKLCCAILGIHDQSRFLDIPHQDVSFLLVEMGAGYNAALGVDGGRIVDGVGGTMSGLGFLTSGEVDMEMVQLGGKWEKSDVFAGGASAIIQDDSLQALVEKRKDADSYEMAWRAMMEDIEKVVASLTVSVSSPREILISGRLTAFEEVREELNQRLSKFAKVRKIDPLENVEEVKEAAQGYAMVAEGLAGGRFSELVEWTEIKKAKGTALDYIYHPKGIRGREVLRKVPFRP